MVDLKGKHRAAARSGGTLRVEAAEVVGVGGHVPIDEVFHLRAQQGRQGAAQPVSPQTKKMKYIHK